MHPAIETLRLYLLATQMADKNSMIPCTEIEVQRMEEVAGYSLPQVYRDFLMTMGKGAGRLGVGFDLFFGKIMGVDRPKIFKNLDTYEVYEFPEPAYIFFLNQGYEAFYFELGTGDNPVVYSYFEGKEASWPCMDSLGSFFLDYAKSWAMFPARSRHNRSARLRQQKRI